MDGRKIMSAVLAAMLAGIEAMAEMTVGVSNVVSRQRYPWNGLVDVDFCVYSSDPNAQLVLSMSATDNEAGRILPVDHVWLESDMTRTNALVVKPGSHRLVWDADADIPDTVSSNVTVSISAQEQAVTNVNAYLVIDVSGGPNAASYPVSYLDAEPQGGWGDMYKTSNIVMRLIQPGTFMMGSPTGEVGRAIDEVQHEVTLTKSFYMGVFEVTQKQYELVTGLTPSLIGGNVGDMKPVEHVTWDMIRGNSSTNNWPTVKTVDPNTFMGRLRVKTGLDGFDLPTEAQWEYACRAGTTTALNNGKDLKDGYLDPAMDDVGRYGYDYVYDWSNCGHVNVGLYQANDWGLYDMHGNVWEWCLDWYVKRLTDDEDPAGPASGSGRVLRGGSLECQAYECRSAYRSGASPSSSLDFCYDDGYGFRLCCSAGLQ